MNSVTCSGVPEVRPISDWPEVECRDIFDGISMFLIEAKVRIDAPWRLRLKREKTARCDLDRDS